MGKLLSELWIILLTFTGNMVKRLNLIHQTVKHLKWTQVVHQVKYRLIRPRALRSYGRGFSSTRIQPLVFISKPPVKDSWQGHGKFSFLNLGVEFKDKVNWNFQEFGKLWNYNLQYANYLLQVSGSDSEKRDLVLDLYQWLTDGRLPLEPYPVSLRSINLIRWISQARIDTPELIKKVYAELDFLSNRLEYHLLGNHLLENGFALMMGGAFFSKEDWLKTAKHVLKKELDEQVLTDGAHFELSPMYHQIIFFRLLELIDWYSKWEEKEQEFEKWLRQKAGRMRAWLQNISFENGDIPHFNDSADGVAHPTPWLIAYAQDLEVYSIGLSLGESGYRSVHLGAYECKIDFAQLGPEYQPGHAHADALSFILYYKGRPLFVEQGTSTYQIGAIRSRERATAAHNTVVVGQLNQSNVWGGFRVAERAKTQILTDGKYRMSAQHDGYRRLNLIHRRTFEFEPNAIAVIDELAGNDKYPKELHLHIYPGIDLEVIDERHVALSNGVTISFGESTKIMLQPYEISNGYNRYETGSKLVVSFDNRLKTSILMRV